MIALYYIHLAFAVNMCFGTESQFAIRIAYQSIDWIEQLSGYFPLPLW